ncbi:MAG: hypothetical protein KGJ80_15840 [Chloroflexota bacterium]|nr:hypothetical protein [Chloroflexota bacterium]
MNQPSAHLREHAERNLGALVVTIEFTLISVMVGVILFPLMDHAQGLLRDLRFEYWLYIVSGLLLILYLWTEVISHSLSFVGWPIEFGHNLLYILFALVLAIQMNFPADPRGWFALSLVSSIVGALVVFYDRRVIERRLSGAEGSAAALYRLALERQRGLLRLVPLTLLNAAADLALIVAFPEFFLTHGGHLILIVIQIFAFLVLLIRTIRAFGSWNQAIVQKAIDELASEGEQ